MSKGTLIPFNAASDNLHEDLVYFMIACNINLTQKSCCGTISIFIQLTVMFGSTTQSECIVVFALQQWLHEYATMLRYTYTAYLVNNGVFCNKSQNFDYQPHLSVT